MDKAPNIQTKAGMEKMKITIACKAVNMENLPDSRKKLPGIRRQVLGDANRNVASWIYSVISAISPRAAEYAENLHGTPGRSAPGWIAKPFSFSLYSTSMGMNIQIRSVSGEFIDLIRKATVNPEALPTLDLRDCEGRGPVLKPEFVGESKNDRGMVQLRAGKTPSGRATLLAESMLFTVSPLVLKGKREHLRLSEAAFTEAGDRDINRYVLQNLLAKHLCNVSPDNEPVPPGLLQIEMEDKTLAISFDRTARMGWTKIKQTVVPFIEGTFRLTTHPELLYAALNHGIGARNGLGFGMVDFHNMRKDAENAGKKIA